MYKYMYIYMYTIIIIPYPIMTTITPRISTMIPTERIITSLLLLVVSDKPDSPVVVVVKETY